MRADFSKQISKQENVHDVVFDDVVIRIGILLCGEFLKRPLGFSVVFEVSF